MKFWELVSIFRSNRIDLRTNLLDPRWITYLNWFDNVDNYIKSSNRTVLDSPLPDELCVEALRLCGFRFELNDNCLRLQTSGDTKAITLTSVDVYKYYGGSVIEEVLEYGSAKVRRVDL